MGDISTGKHEINNASAAEGDKKKSGGDGGEADETRPPTEAGQETIKNTKATQDKAPKPHRDYHDWLMLAFVFLAFLAAAFAAHYTREEVKVSRNNAQKELRAYVFVRSYPIVNGASINGRPHTNIILKNAGQTPASKVVVTARFQPGDEIAFILPREMLDRFDEPPLDPRSETKRAVRVTISEMGRKTLWLMNKSGDWRFILSGDVSYKDVFGADHRTHFCFLYSGLVESPDGGNGSPLKSNCPHPEDY